MQNIPLSGEPTGFPLSRYWFLINVSFLKSMTISEAQSDEESDCHRRYSYNSEWGGIAWALNDTETILVSVFTYIDNWCGRRNPSPVGSLHQHKAQQCQGSIWEWWLITAARGWAVRALVLCHPAANITLQSSISGVLYPSWKEKLISVQKIIS